MEEDKSKEREKRRKSEISSKKKGNKNIENLRKTMGEKRENKMEK